MLTISKVGLCFLFLGITLIDTSGQATGNPKQDFLYGEYYFNQARYNDALPFYLSVLRQFPDNSNVNYRVGECYMRLLGSQEKALPYLQKAVKKIDPYYVAGKYKEKEAPPEAWVLLGDAYHRDDQLRNASFAYYQYKKLIGNSDKDKLDMIDKRIEGLGISYEYQRSEHTYKLVNLGSVINSRFSDYNPVMSNDQKTLIYSQYWETYDKIMLSHKTTNGWTTPIELNDKIGSAGDCYTSALSADGKQLFLIRYGNAEYDIYESRNINGEWQKMQRLEGKVNSRHQETSVCISADDKTLYFSSDRPGGYGGFDIYKATLKNGSWGDITNLGKNINTKGNEEAPFITADGSELYFSSNGHESVGNMDILYSKLGDDGKWEKPVNFGLPVNTTNDDLFFIFFKNTHTGYLARDMKTGYGKNDIYELKMNNDSIIPNKSLTAPNSKQNNNSEAKRSNDTLPVKKNVEFKIQDTLPTQSSIHKKSKRNNSVTQHSPSRKKLQHSPSGSTKGVKTGSTNNSNKTEIKANDNLHYGTEKEISKTTNKQALASSGDNDGSISSKNINRSFQYQDTSLSQTSVRASSDSGIRPVNKDPTYLADQQDTEIVPKNSQQTMSKISPHVHSTNSANISGSNSSYVSENTVEQEKEDNHYSNTKITAAQNNSESIPTYTIQIIALLHPVKASYFKLAPLKISAGNDGFYRYTYGEYHGYSLASKQLKKIKKTGFTTAFVRNIATIENYASGLTENEKN